MTRFISNCFNQKFEAKTFLLTDFPGKSLVILIVQQCLLSLLAQEVNIMNIKKAKQCTSNSEPPEEQTLDSSVEPGVARDFRSHRQTYTTQPYVSLTTVLSLTGPGPGPILGSTPGRALVSSASDQPYLLCFNRNYTQSGSVAGSRKNQTSKHWYW